MTTLESVARFSLAKYANYSLAAIVIAVTLAITGGLWVIHEQNRNHDAAIVKLLAQKNAQLLSDQLAFHQGRLDDEAVQATLEKIVEVDEHIVVWGADGHPIAQVGDVIPESRSVQAIVDVVDSSWQLQVSRRTSNHISVYVLKGTVLWFVSFVAVAVTILSFRVFITTVRELKHLGKFLQQISTGPFAIDPPSCEIRETSTLLPAIERIATDLHARQEAIAQLSFTDNVTKLPNRVYFFEQFRHAFELAKRGSDICLLVLEINGFQKATDVLGDEPAEAILRMLADTLHNQTRKSDFAARLGMSRFAAIFYNAKGSLMQNRLKQLQNDFATRQQKSTATAGEVYCTLACGMTYVDNKNDTRAEEVVSRAESAVQTAKKAGGDHIAVVPPVHDDSGDSLAVAGG